MASEKKPSIYSDRGTIGSSDELDEYGVWVKTEPQDLSLAGGPEAQEEADIFMETSGEISDIETSDDTPPADDLDLAISDLEDLPDFDTLQEEASKNIPPEDDFSLPEEDEPLPETGLDLPDMVMFEDTAENSDEASDDGFAEISMDDFIGTLDTEPTQDEPLEEVAVADTPVKQPEIAAEALEASESSPPVSSAGSGQVNSSPDLSTQLLMRIAEELSSIRTELSSLKKEFSELKTAVPPSDAAESGFFNKEEDDEKIALTGDELNNILNTADFTEEAGADATMELSEDLGVTEPEDKANDTTADDISAGDELNLELMDFDISLDDTDMPELEGEYSGEVKDEEVLPAFTEEDTEELKHIRESGAEPMAFAPAPEDENYLTEDPLAQDPLVQETSAGESLVQEAFAEEPLEEAPLDEEFLAQEPLVEEPLTEEPLIDEPLIEEPLVDDTAGFEEISTELDIEPFNDISAETTAENLLEPEASADSPIEEHFPDESIDLSEAIIDEPDLSAEIQDNPLEEPSLDDISISLDLSELGSDEISLSEPEDDEIHAGFEEPLLPLDISESELQSLEEAEDEAAEEEVPLSPETDSDEQGGDLSLIPEAFLVESEDATGADLSAADEPHPSEDEPEAVITQEELDVLETDLESESEKLEEIQEEIFTEVSLPEEIISEESIPAAAAAETNEVAESTAAIPTQLKHELKTVLSYMDQLLESLPDEKIEEFARSEYYDTYKKLFKELGLV